MNEMDFECQNYLKNVQNKKQKQKKRRRWVQYSIEIENGIH